METKDFARRVRVALASQDLISAELARRLEVPPTTLSSWLNGRHPIPDDLPARIERALDLPTGALGGVA